MFRQIRLSVLDFSLKFCSLNRPRRFIPHSLKENDNNYYNNDTTRSVKGLNRQPLTLGSLSYADGVLWVEPMFKLF